MKIIHLLSLSILIVSASPQITHTSFVPLAKAGLYSTLGIHSRETIKSENINSELHSTRPVIVQKQIDEEFEKHKNNNQFRNNFYSSSSEYSLLSLDNEKVIDYVALADQEKNDIYIVGVGGSSICWGQNIMKMLQSEKYKQSGKRFHIFSLVSDKECDKEIQKHGHVTLYQYNQFNIENISEELSKRGHNLQDKVDLVVSTNLQYLVDPFGILKSMYKLLSPKTGLLISKGEFLFKCNDKLQQFPVGNEEILTTSSATILFNYYSDTHHGSNFILRRTNHDELEIPKYTGNLEKNQNLMFGTRFFTEFDPTHHQKIVLKKMPLDEIPFSRGTDDVKHVLYCAEGDTQCENLFNVLKANKLFRENPTDSLAK